MKLFYPFREPLKKLLLRFYDHQNLGLVLDLSFPAEDRADTGDDVHAGRQPFLDKGSGYLHGIIFSGSGYQYDDGWHVGLLMGSEIPLPYVLRPEWYVFRLNAG